jgi:DNA transformation protein and related proteins
MDDDLLRDLFAGLGPITIRRMFGGKGIYSDDLIIALVAFDWIKTDGETQDRFRAAGSEPFVYAGRDKPVTMPYWSLPDEAIDDPDRLAVWARLGREAARRTASGETKPRRRSAARSRGAT